MAISVYLLFLFLSGALCIIDLEVYDKIKENSSFEVLEYDQIREIFKNVHKPNPDEVIRKRQELEEHISSKLKEVDDLKPFLALTKPKLYVPNEYDPRKIMPDCFTKPKHQGNCGSCYIFAPVAAYESRMCLLSGGKIKPELSQEDILSCGTKHNKCGGGLITDTWEYLENTGASSYQCKPYVSSMGSVPTCTYKCDNPKLTYDKWMTVQGSLHIFGNFDYQQMKEQIYNWGPINAFMETFEDLWAYRGGLYFHKTGKPTEAHAITIIGWGYDSSTKSEYWIIRNSWGPDWGEGGYLKVAFGLYGIGSYVATSVPYV